jgi:glucokinase
MESPASDRAREVVLAVDIGGTKMAVAAVDGAGNVIWSERTPTPAGAGPETLWATLAELVDSAPESWRYLACGVGCGGPMGPRGEWVSPLNIPGWTMFPLRSRLAALTGLSTFVDNDAKALALGEGWVGTAAGESDYMALVVSTGVGGGIVVDGRLLDGRTGNAGHVGHLIVEPGGRECRCGARGCLEAEASGTAIQAITGRPAAQANAATVARTGRLVGRAAGDVANLLDLRLVTVSGSVAFGYGQPFFDAAQAELDITSRLSFSSGCRVVAGKLGDRGPIVGAAAVALTALGALDSPGVGGSRGAWGER